MKGKAVAIGTFDGVHRGHVAVIEKLKKVARENSLEPMVITFDRHPLSLIAPERAPLAITSVERKADLIRRLGVTPVIMPFDEKMRSTTARDWMRMLHDSMEVRALIVGYDNTFGCDGVAMSVADYRRLGDETGIDVEEAPYVADVSSSAIRKAIAAGDISHANNLLGREFSLRGMIVTGNQLGRTIGFPTANMIPHPGIIVPGNGVYAATATLPDGCKKMAVVNIGVRPTVRRGNSLTIEAHIIGWKGDLYGHELKLNFHKRLRDEMKFNSIESLRRQIEKDTHDTIFSQE